MRLTLQYHVLDTGVSRRDTGVSRREKFFDTCLLGLGVVFVGYKNPKSRGCSWDEEIGMCVGLLLFCGVERQLQFVKLCLVDK